MKQRFHRLFATIATATLSTVALLSSASSVIAQEQTAATLNVGDSVPPLNGITWLQGAPVKSLDEKGKIYMLELWATWCGPCVAIIPHVNDLHKKYEEKGLVIIGMNVWEEQVETPTAFLKKQGDGMSYRVAFSGGKDGRFATEWLTPAGVQRIPHALIIKEGKLIFKGHPALLKNSTIEAMLDGSYQTVTDNKQSKTAAQAEEEFRNKSMSLLKNSDWDGLLKLANTLEDENPTKIQLQLTAISQKSDWNALAEIRSKLITRKNPPISPEQVDAAAALGMKNSEGAKPYAAIALKNLKKLGSQDSIEDQLRNALVKSRLNFLAGNTKEAAQILTTVKPMIEKINTPQMKQQLKTIFPAAEKAITEGQFPTISELLSSQQ